MEGLFGELCGQSHAAEREGRAARDPRVRCPARGQEPIINQILYRSFRLCWSKAL